MQEFLKKSSVFYKKSMFFTFFLKNIWWFGKKVVPLQSETKTSLTY